MFSCEVCGRQSVPGSKSFLEVLESRPKHYPPRLYHRKSKRLKTYEDDLRKLTEEQLHRLLMEWEIVDWGGEGTETLKQRRVCEACKNEAGAVVKIVR